MRGVNKVIIVGNLGNDPEVKQFPNGGSITTISVATSEQWNDKQTGEKREATEWHRITFNNKLAEIAAQYLRKGSQVYVEGSLRTRKFQDQSGQDRFITEIRADQLQMLGGRPMGQGGNESYPTNGSHNTNDNFYNNQPNYQNSYNPPSNGYNPNTGNQNYNQHTGNQSGYHAPQNPPIQTNQFLNQNPAAAEPKIETPKPGIVDDDVPFGYISNQLVEVI